jgi:AcrR family transcriptional regulator
MLMVSSATVWVRRVVCEQVRFRPPSPGTIQRNALRLFRKQGYAATTVEQIADAAEVSPSTFFRYFPTKEDVVLYDPTDLPMLAAFEAQAPDLPPIPAIRAAMREVFGGLSREELVAQLERGKLIRAEPELRSRMIDTFVDGIQVFSEFVAKRVGRSPDDMAVRTFVGAFIGAVIAVYLSASDLTPENYFSVFDAALDHLEAGLPL